MVAKDIKTERERNRERQDLVAYFFCQKEECDAVLSGVAKRVVGASGVHLQEYQIYGRYRRKKWELAKRDSYYRIKMSVKELCILIPSYKIYLLCFFSHSCESKGSRDIFLLKKPFSVERFPSLSSILWSRKE